MRSACFNFVLYLKSGVGFIVCYVSNCLSYQFTLRCKQKVTHILTLHFLRPLERISFSGKKKKHHNNTSIQIETTHRTQSTGEISSSCELSVSVRSSQTFVLRKAPITTNKREAAICLLPTSITRTKRNAQNKQYKLRHSKHSRTSHFSITTVQLAETTSLTPDLKSRPRQTPKHKKNPKKLCPSDQ